MMYINKRKGLEGGHFINLESKSLWVLGGADPPTFAFYTVIKILVPI